MLIQFHFPYFPPYFLREFVDIVYIIKAFVCFVEESLVVTSNYLINVVLNLSFPPEFVTIKCRNHCNTLVLSLTHVVSDTH